MKKTIVAMLVSGTILFPGLSQAQTLEQSVAQSLATCVNPPGCSQTEDD
ncbi:hypothetical protein [Aeromonas media]|nr:hypothetical protein [Aeromonas media]